MKSLLKFLAKQPRKTLLQRLGFGVRPLPPRAVHAVSEHSRWARLLGRLSRQPDRALTDGVPDSIGVLIGAAWSAVLVFAIGWCMTAPKKGDATMETDVVMAAESIDKASPVTADTAGSGVNEAATPSIEAAVSRPPDTAGEPANATDAAPKSIIAAVTPAAPAPPEPAETGSQAEQTTGTDAEQAQAMAAEPAGENVDAEVDRAPAQQSWAAEAAANDALANPEPASNAAPKTDASTTAGEAKVSEPEPAPVAVALPDQEPAIAQKADSPAVADHAAESVAVAPPPATEESDAGVTVALAAPPVADTPASPPESTREAARESVAAADTGAAPPAGPLADNAAVLQKAKDDALLDRAIDQYLQGAGSEAIASLEEALKNGTLHAQNVGRAEQLRRGLRQLRVLYQDAAEAARNGDETGLQRSARLYELAERTLIPGQSSVYLQRIRTTQATMASRESGFRTP